MPTVAQLTDSLQQADAAGDKEAAQAFADAIRQMGSSDAAPAVQDKPNDQFFSPDSNMGAVIASMASTQPLAAALNSRKAMGAAAQIGVTLGATALAPEATIPAMVFRALSGLAGGRINGTLNNQAPKLSDDARNMILAGAPIPSPGAGNILSAETLKNLAKGGLTAGGTVIASNLAGDTIDKGHLPASFEDYKDTVKGVLMPSIIGAATFGLSGKLQSMADLQKEADAGKLAMQELGASQPTLGDAIPKKYAELQAQVASTTPEIAAKIQAARAPITKAFYAKIGDTPMNETIATELTPIMQRVDQADAAYQQAADVADKAIADRQKLFGKIVLSPAQKSQINEQTTSTVMDSITAQAKAAIQQQVGADLIGTQTGKAETLKTLVGKLFGARSQIASNMMEKTGIDPKAAIFNRDELLSAATSALGDDAETTAGKAILNTIGNFGTLSAKDAAIAKQAQLSKRLNEVASGGKPMTAQEYAALAGPPKQGLYQAGTGLKTSPQAQEPVFLTLDEFRRLRDGMSSGFVGKIDTNNMSNAERIASKAYGGMGEATEATVGANYGPEALADFKNFKSFWRDTSKLRDSKFGQSMLNGEISDSTIAAMADKLASGNVDEVKNYKEFVDLIRPQNQAVADSAMAVMGSAIKNSMKEKATNAAGVLDVRSLFQNLQKAASKTDMPIPIELLGYGDKDTITGVNKALQQFKPTDLTTENIQSVMESPQIQSVLKIGGKSTGGYTDFAGKIMGVSDTIKTKLATLAFGKRVQDAVALEQAGAMSQAQKAYNEAGYFAHQAGLKAEDAADVLKAARDNPLTNVFSGKSGYTLTNEADKVSGQGTITHLVDNMKRDEAKTMIGVLREQKPDLADMVERRLLANEFDQFYKGESSVPGTTRGLDVGKVRDYFEPKPGNTDNRFDRLKYVLGADKLNDFKKFATNLAQLDDTTRAAVIASKTTHPTTEAVGLGRLAQTGSVMRRNVVTATMKSLGDMYNRKKFNLLSSLIMDDGLMNSFNRSQGNIGEAIASLPAQKAYLLLNDKRIANELAPDNN